LLLGGFDTQEDVPEVFAEVRSMLAEVVRPCSCFGQRCRHNAYVALGDVNKLRLSNWPRAGLLDVVGDAQFQKFRSRVL
jgi:hypothetical protein